MKINKNIYKILFIILIIVYIISILGVAICVIINTGLAVSLMSFMFWWINSCAIASIIMSIIYHKNKTW